ncbi:caspase-6-like [Diadema antillarum]|uniref:caspase-6-like n=1 Tax=Diadema antillarum TaxID=105358 RepID=UPI003A879D8C
MDKPEADQALVGDNPTSTDNEESGSTEADARTGVLTTLSASQNAASRSRERNQEMVFQFPGFLESLSRDDTARLLYYNMNHPKRGMALIFNHENFDYQTGMNKRVNHVTFPHLFLDFECLAAKTNHTDSDCFMCVFLTHGDDGIIYGRDQTLELQELFDFFRGENCPTLVGKPKLFLIQACRGEKHEIGVKGFDAVDSAEEESMTVTDSGARPTVPAAADMLLSYSVVQGYYSHRDTAYGSWYVQALAKILSLHGTTMEITEILTLLNQLISQRAVERCLDSRMIGKKQMPCFMSMLTKKLIFTPKKL